MQLMSSEKTLGKKKGRNSLRALALAGASIAAIGVAGVGASDASAATCGGRGTFADNVIGQGSTLQNALQGNWAHSPSGTTNAFSSDCSDIDVEYNTQPGGPTGSQGALNAWGASGGSFDSSINYLGTDDPPTTNQLANIDARSGANTVVLPVSQTAIAIVAHPPANCTVTGLTQADLQGVFAGTITTWDDLALDSGSGCTDASITRVVRSDGSGTTFQLKHFLDLINSGATVMCSTDTWARLADANPNTTWPAAGSCSGTPALDPQNGGGGVAGEVNARAGTIGYAALPDAKARAASWIVNVEANRGSFPRNLVAPDTGSDANCAGVPYSNVPTAGNDQDWTRAFGLYTNTTPNGGQYPICTLTYDVGLTTYSTGGAAVLAATKRYLSYEVNAGQSSRANWYQALPSTVLTNAQTTVSSFM
jgi:phosphate transport system substrate-binding protein